MSLPELNAISLQCSRDQQRTILFCGSEPGDGSSTLSYAMAQRIAGTGRRVLFVDFSPQSSFTNDCLQLPKQDWDLAGSLKPEACFSIEGRNLTILAAPCSGAFSLEHCEENVIRGILTDWLDSYDVIIADAPPIDRGNRTGLPTETLAAAFDCTILVVLSGQTLLVQLKKVIDRLQEAGTVIGGIVMNDRELPDLRDEFGRQADRIGRRLPRMARAIKRWLNNRRVFAVEF